MGKGYELSIYGEEKLKGQSPQEKNLNLKVNQRNADFKNKKILFPPNNIHQIFMKKMQTFIDRSLKETYICVL